jgi:hypothetical protein
VEPDGTTVGAFDDRITVAAGVTPSPSSINFSLRASRELEVILPAGCEDDGGNVRREDTASSDNPSVFAMVEGICAIVNYYRIILSLLSFSGNHFGGFRLTILYSQHDDHLQ